MSFGMKLKELRKNKSMTQKELGEKLHLSERVIGFYESNERFPKGGETLKEIADLFDVTIDYLLGRQEKPVDILNVKGLEESEINAIKLIVESLKQKKQIGG